MDTEKLRTLQIAPEAKRRPERPIWLIFGAVLLLSGTAVYFAWPRSSDNRRVWFGSGSNKTLATISNALAASNISASTTNDSILTVSGYIINRERIELSPRFMGVVKWIGVKKGDAVTNGQVVVLLDDAEYRARLHETEGRLANANVAVEKAELDYGRTIKLSNDKVESKEAEDAARIRLDSARAAVKEIEGQHDLAKAYLDWTVI